MQNPKPFLYGLIGKRVCVRLKWGETEYEGTLASVDSYMDLQLDETEEYINGESQGILGEVMIRCNNVLWVGEARDRASEAGLPSKKTKTESTEPAVAEVAAAEGAAALAPL